MSLTKEALLISQTKETSSLTYLSAPKVCGVSTPAAARTGPTFPAHHWGLAAKGRLALSRWRRHHWRRQRTCAVRRKANDELVFLYAFDLIELDGELAER